MNLTKWSKSVNGLQISMDIANETHHIGDSIPIILHFKNIRNKNIRIYLINSEIFRYGQSTISILSKKDRNLISIQPEPHPHGYKVTEEDFHLIEPNQELTFDQTIYIMESKFESGGKFIVQWNYENQVKSWPKNIMTLDGPTKELFGGKAIPFIWTGSISYKTNIEII